MKIATILLCCCVALVTHVNADPTIWKAIDILDVNTAPDIGRYAVLVLNRPINMRMEYVVNILNKAKYRAAADGGANRWYEFVTNATGLEHFNPDLIVGELDQIDPHTLEYAEKRGAKVVKNDDQDKTDITRGCEEIVKQTGGQIDSVIAISETSGRLDKIMANLNTMYDASKVFGNLPIRLYLLSTESLSWILPAGSHEIHIPHSLIESDQKCGLIPIGAPAMVTTNGLKWNLNDNKMEFGGLISTSNKYKNDVVTVKTDSPLLWTMVLEEKSQQPQDNQFA